MENRHFPPCTSNFCTGEDQNLDREVNYKWEGYFKGGVWQPKIKIFWPSILKDMKIVEAKYIPLKIQVPTEVKLELIWGMRVKKNSWKNITKSLGNLRYKYEESKKKF